MKTTNEIIMEMAGISEFVMEQSAMIHTKPTISINECKAMIITARQDALMEAAERSERNYLKHVTDSTGDTSTYIMSPKESILSLLKENV